ncbi:hypothetical protein NFI96_028746 [Prochilodus magdalenae]|nr:hypothetical protein NFI96_028746 [Prochilodus magdalenae]
MAKSIESDKSGAENLDLEEHLQSGSVCASDDLRVRDLGVRMRYLGDELEIPSNSNKDGPWNLVYESVGSRLSSLKKLFKQSEVASVQPMAAQCVLVKVKKASLVSSAGFRCSGADWGSSPSLSDAVRVLHVEEAGVSIEPCQLSCHSAGLLHPRFSPRGVLVRTGFSVKAHCEVLIYCTLTAHLTLHVYLVPCDAKMIESVQKQENGSIRIPKPHPDISLQMKNRYTLSTSCSSTITPQRLKLRYTTQTPNYFEVYIKDVNEDFQLRLTSEEEEEEPVWKADIRSAEYRRSPSRGGSTDEPELELVAGFYSGQHFVDVHRKSLIQRVKLVEPIADDLYPKISEEKYSKIAKAGTSQDKMRVIYDILLSGGPSLKDVLLQSLQQNEPDLLEELSQS